MNKFNASKQPTKREENDPAKEKALDDQLTLLNKLKLVSLQKQEEIINSNNIPNKKELINNFNTSKIKYTTKINEVKSLGNLGFKLEEMRLRIENRYEFMLHDLNQKLETIKKFFNNLINDVKGEAFNSIVNEKDHNLSNIKEYLEDKLMKIKEGKNTSNSDDTDYESVEASFNDFFDFFGNFTEECFGLIASKSSNLNIENLKKQLQAFKSRNLDSLLNPPKVFTSELFRFFEGGSKNIEDLKKKEKISFGDFLDIDQTRNEDIKFMKSPSNFDPELNSKSKTPMTHIINEKYLLIATRDKFRISSYSYSSNDQNVPKSKFYQTVHNEKGEKLNTKDVYCSTDLEMNINSEMGSYHSICTARHSDDSYFIMLGGNNCVVFG